MDNPSWFNEMMFEFLMEEQREMKRQDSANSKTLRSYRG